jgi:deoxyribonuclease V
MMAALDVHYDEPCNRGRAAAVVFAKWEDAGPAGEFLADVENIQPYVPGEFYRRELPCLLAVLSKIDRILDVVVIDGYVRLNDKPGLGEHLFDTLGRRIPVIGVAKTRFVGAPALEILRGRSKAPLYVSTAGIDAREAGELVSRMHGPHRIPTLLKRVDGLARKVTLKA